MLHTPSMLSTVGSEPGLYFSWLKILVYLVLALPWLWACAWMDKDTKVTRMPREVWLSAGVAGGVLGLLIWLLVPVFIVGLGVYLVIILAIGTVYVVQRNAKVVPEARVLTRDFFADLLERRKEASVDLVSRLKVYDSSGQPAVLPQDGTVEMKTVFNRAQDLLYDILWRRASEVDISPASAEALGLRYFIDGLVVPCEPLERPVADGVIDYIKRLAGMDPEDRRRPQNGKVAVDLAGQQVDIDIVAAGSTSGPRMQLKIVQEAVRTQLTELGMPQEILAEIKKINARRKGLTLVAAKSRNGLTSTLYSLMRAHDAYTEQLMTVEVKPEADMENVTQSTYKDPADMARVLAGVLRRDPSVVMVDQCTTADGAERVLAGAAGLKVMLGVSAKDSFYALAQWVKVAGDAAAAVAPINAVLSQVLLRRLCPACREAYQPNTDLLRKANLPTDKVEQFYRPPANLTDEKGRPIICPTCQGSGYLGRTAAFELLTIDDGLRQLLTAGAGLTKIKAAARKRGMLYLQEQALRLVMEGITSVEEVIRVTQTKQR
jgi:type II secretory ATPase GspE/PulE/Tfp pilus assembly ATPase PilB-like protein